MSGKGFFLITDITGYTSFLTQSELDHAQHIIEALFDRQLKAIQPPLRVSNFQGDAILCYASGESLESGGEIIRQVIQIYEAFAAQMEKMQINPPCSCKVCATIDLLDLKIFLHFGEYIVKKIGDREELIGPDVILAHRMMKNSVIDQTGIKSYLLLTEAAKRHLDMKDYDLELVDHVESYEHIGPVKMFVASLPDISQH